MSQRKHASGVKKIMIPFIVHIMPTPTIQHGEIIKTLLGTTTIMILNLNI